MTTADDAESFVTTDDEGALKGAVICSDALNNICRNHEKLFYGIEIVYVNSELLVFDF
jgi:hypothetical protein